MEKIVPCFSTKIIIEEDLFLKIKEIAISRKTDIETIILEHIKTLN